MKHNYSPEHKQTGQFFCLLVQIDDLESNAVDYRILALYGDTVWLSDSDNINGKLISDVPAFSNENLMHFLQKEVQEEVAHNRIEFEAKGFGLWIAAEIFPVDMPGHSAVIFTNITAGKSFAQADLKSPAIKKSDRKNQEKQQVDLWKAIKHNDFTQAIIDSSPDMIQVFKAIRDAYGEIIDFRWVLNNPVAESRFGDVIGKNLLENNPGVVEAGIFDAFVRVTETGRAERYEKHYSHEQFDGWFDQSVVRIDDGVATTTSDITARKAAELNIVSLNRELIAKNGKLETLHLELQTFADVAANDYKSILRSLYISFEEILRQDATKLSDASKANIRRTQSNIQKLKLLTDDLISYLELSSAGQQRTLVNLANVFDSVAGEITERWKDKNISVRSASNVPQIIGFPVLISLMVRHILGNSVKFSHTDISPEIKITWKAVTGKSIGREAEANFYEISFSDNGVGFDNNHAEDIFKIFFKLNDGYRVSGVGLAICRKIMNLHDGFITAESCDSEGTVIKCYFPAL